MEKLLDEFRRQEQEAKNYSPVAVAAALDLGMTKTRELIASGAIRSFRIGRLIRVRHEALVEYLEAQAGNDRQAG